MKNPWILLQCNLLLSPFYVLGKPNPKKKPLLLFSDLQTPISSLPFGINLLVSLLMWLEDHAAWFGRRPLNPSLLPRPSSVACHYRADFGSEAPGLTSLLVDTRSTSRLLWTKTPPWCCVFKVWRQTQIPSLERLTSTEYKCPSPLLKPLCTTNILKDLHPYNYCIHYDVIYMLNLLDHKYYLSKITCLNCLGAFLLSGAAIVYHCCLSGCDLYWPMEKGLQPFSCMLCSEPFHKKSSQDMKTNKPPVDINNNNTYAVNNNPALSMDEGVLNNTPDRTVSQGNLSPYENNTAPDSFLVSLAMNYWCVVYAFQVCLLYSLVKGINNLLAIRCYVSIPACSSQTTPPSKTSDVISINITSSSKDDNLVISTSKGLKPTEYSCLNPINKHTTRTSCYHTHPLYQTHLNNTACYSIISPPAIGNFLCTSNFFKRSRVLHPNCSSSFINQPYSLLTGYQVPFFYFFILMYMYLNLDLTFVLMLMQGYALLLSTCQQQPKTLSYNNSPSTSLTKCDYALNGLNNPTRLALNGMYNCMIFPLYKTICNKNFSIQNVEYIKWCSPIKTPNIPPCLWNTRKENQYNNSTVYPDILATPNSEICNSLHHISTASLYKHYYKQDLMKRLKTATIGQKTDALDLVQRLLTASSARVALGLLQRLFCTIAAV